MNELEFQRRRDAGLKYRVRNFLIATLIPIFARPSAVPLLKIISRGSLFLQGLGSGSVISRSGEARFLKRAFRESDLVPVVLDVGGNLGDYSNEILQSKPDANIYIFEPGSFLNAHLRKRFQGNKNIQIESIACSDKIERKRLVAKHEGATTGSFYHAEGDDYSHSEEIFCTTIDEYIRSNEIGEVGLLKVDVEGHELKVLLGASEALSQKKIQVVQFDGGAAPNSRIFFADFWELFTVHGYEVYRLLPMGAVRVTSYSHSDECCLPTVYLAVRPGLNINL